MSELLHIPVRINQKQVREDDPDTNLILQKINRLTLEPFDSLDDVFLMSGVCSNDRLDAYFTKMDPETTLRNYEQDLRSGVSLLPNHDITQSPFGRSYDGVLENNEVNAYWYIVRDLTINGEATNDTIRAIQTGIKRDLSVGFGGELWYKCSSCGRDMWDWECGHFPGLEDENSMRTFAWIMDAHLREVSTVYKGATPGAYINKARQYVEQGELPKSSIMKLENAYNIRLDNGERSFYMPNTKNEKEDEEMPQSARNSLLEDIRTAIRENKIEKAVVYDILSEEGDPFRQPEDIALRNELGKDHCSIAAIRQLKKEAQQGRRYLADVIDQAVSARVRAQGDSFNADSYRSMLTLSGDIDHIKDEIDSYERLAKEKFVAGRQTEPEDLGKDQEEPEQQEPEMRFDPDEENIFADQKKGRVE